MTAVAGCRLSVAGKTVAGVATFAMLLSLAAAGEKPHRSDDDVPLPTHIYLELSPPERAGDVVKVLALDRNVSQEMIDKEVRTNSFAGSPDRDQPGRWVFNLGPGTYDLYVETKDGKFEGYNPRLTEKSDGQLTDEDRGKVSDIFGIVKTYEDEKRMLNLGGNDKQAVALVELIRRGQTSLKPDIVTWRVELWRFEKLYGVWRREDQSKVLRRFLVPAKEFAGWNWNFVPELGGIELQYKWDKTIKWIIPEKFDSAKGRAASSPPEAPRGPPAAGPSAKTGETSGKTTGRKPD